jgi:hypothetical protein
MLLRLEGTQCREGWHSLNIVPIELTVIVVEGADLPASEVSLREDDLVPVIFTSYPPSFGR